jgi:hypothetical protein
MTKIYNYSVISKYLIVGKQPQIFVDNFSIARSNEILGWEGVGNRQLFYFFKA